MVPNPETIVLPMGTKLQEGWFHNYEPLGDTSDDIFRRWQNGVNVVTWAEDATGLSTVVVDGSDQDLVQQLPAMTYAEASDLIGGSDEKTVIAGLRAASLLNEPRLATLVATKIWDNDPVISMQAFEALSRIVSDAFEKGTVSLGQALFSVPGWRNEKLQILRRFRRDMPSVTQHASDCLARALVDPDWEIRATAMLAACRLDLRELRTVVAKAPMPRGRQDGLTKHECRGLDAMKAAVVEHLSGRQNARLPESVRQAVAGDSSALDSDLKMIFQALDMPVFINADCPPHPLLELDATGQLRTKDGHAVTWVPPGAYVLGDAVAGTESRPKNLAQGFFVDVSWRGAGDLDHARTAARLYGNRFKANVTLPTSDQLELAARGPDGRRFPWGLNADRACWSDLSPLGLQDLVAKTGEWLADSELTSGGARSPAQAQRVATNPTALCGYRFVYV